MLTRQIEKAQRKVEAHNFDIRKHLLMFDDVANDQRKVVYQQRTEIMGTEDLSAAIAGICERRRSATLARPVHAASRRAGGLGPRGPGRGDRRSDFNARIDPKAWLEAEPELEEQALRERVVAAVDEAYDAKVRAPVRTAACRSCVTSRST